MRRHLLLAAALAVLFPASVAPADGQSCPLDTAAAAKEQAAGNRLYLVAHTTKGWVLMMYGVPGGGDWRVYAINHRHEACISSEGDHLEIMRP